MKFDTIDDKFSKLAGNRVKFLGPELLVSWKPLVWRPARTVLRFVDVSLPVFSHNVAEPATFQGAERGHIVPYPRSLPVRHSVPIVVEVVVGSVLHEWLLFEESCLWILDEIILRLEVVYDL